MREDTAEITYGTVIDTLRNHASESEPLTALQIVERLGYGDRAQVSDTVVRVKQVIKDIRQRRPYGVVLGHKPTNSTEGFWIIAQDCH